MSIVGISEKIIRKYIEMQDQEDSGQARLNSKMLPFLTDGCLFERIENE